jgi:tight adherence protein B
VSVSQLTGWLGYGGIALFVIGLTVVATLVLFNPQSGPRRAFRDYEATLERELRFLLYRSTGARVARIQLGVLLGLLVGAALLEDLLLAILVIPTAFMPLAWLQSKHAQRVVVIELQLDSWLQLLANSLKATPSLGEGIASSAKLMRAPLGEELDLVLKELALGTPLDQAVMNMSTRVGSRPVSGALATILVGRQTGGDLTRILEESAATLREMARLEGVVRTKTAEGKSQAYVLGSIPFVLLGALYMVDPYWLQPLAETTMGYVIIAVATSLWLAAIILARKILAVDV